MKTKIILCHGPKTKGVPNSGRDEKVCNRSKLFVCYRNKMHAVAHELQRKEHGAKRVSAKTERQNGPITVPR